MSQQFCLKWNNHMNNMMDCFKNLQSSGAMVDVTLACDGLSLKAHKIVLSACSPFFQTLFLENPCKHPIVILKDMKYSELKAIIEFMYQGEVNVAQDQLSALMKTAETLKVRGLAEVTNDNESGDESSRKSAPRTGTPPSKKRKKGRTRKRSISDQSDDISEPRTQQPDSDIEELPIDVNPKTAYSTSTVPLQSRTSSLHKPRQEQQPPVNDSIASEESYSIEAPKFLQQSLTADDLPRRSSRSSVQSNMELERRPQSSTVTDDHSSSFAPVTSTPMLSNALVVANQQPEILQDIKPELLDLDPPMLEPPVSPVAGPSHSTDENSMMYMDQSNMSTMSGPSGFQDDSALESADPQPQGTSQNFQTDSRLSPLSLTEKKEVVVYQQQSLHFSQFQKIASTSETHPPSSSIGNPNDFKRNEHVCEVCSQSFTYKHNLKAHYRLHTGEKPYKCQICKKEYTFYPSLKNHLLSAHFSVLSKDANQREQLKMLLSKKS